MTDLILKLRSGLPAVLQDAGEEASERVIEFFTAEIRNENKRKAYARAGCPTCWASRLMVTKHTLCMSKFEIR